MSTCIRSGACTFFQRRMSEMPTSAEIFINNYCLSDKERCARNMIFDKLLQGYAPTDDEMMGQIEKEVKNIYPNDTDRAKKVMGWLVKY